MSFASIAFALLMTMKQPPARRAFFIINTTGYNIGLCTLPYMAVSKGRGGVKKGEVLKTLFSSMLCVTNLVMILLTAGRVSLPQSVYTIAGMRLFAGVVYSFFIYHFLPVPLLYRQILSVIVFSPIRSTAPVYTEHCGYLNASAAVLNSLMLPASLVVMTVLLMGMDIF